MRDLSGMLPIPYLSDLDFSMKYIFVLVACGCLSQIATSQRAGWGITGDLDLYSRYVNPPDGIASRGAGSAILNPGISVKGWLGNADVTISPEAGFVLSPFALSIGDFKGLGAVAFPLLVKLEFLGNSNLNREGRVGFGLGGGVQYNRTELFFLTDVDDQNIDREYFRTYVAEADFGFGLNGFDVHTHVRFGWNAEIEANSLNVGIGVDLNLSLLRETTDPEF